MGENKVWFIKQARALSEEHRCYISNYTRLSGAQDLAVGLYILNRVLKIKGRFQKPKLPVSLHVFLWASACATGSGDAVSCSTQPSASWSICLLLAPWLNRTERTRVSQISLQPFGYDCFKFDKGRWGCTWKCAVLILFFLVLSYCKDQ